MADTRVLKTRGLLPVPVRVRSPAPERKLKIQQVPRSLCFNNDSWGLQDACAYGSSGKWSEMNSLFDSWKDNT